MNRWLMLAVVAGRAAAQTPTVEHTPDFSVEQLTPAPGPGTFLQVEDAQTLPAGGMIFGAVSSAAGAPLVVRDSRGDMITRPVSFRLGIDLLGAVGVWGPVQVGVALPVVAYQSGDRLRGLELPEADAEEPLPSTAVGDLRLHAKLRLRSPRLGYGFGAAAAAVVTLPTGGAQGFYGERGLVVEARGIASYRTPGGALALNIGLRGRSSPVMFLRPTVTIGNELTWGMAVSVALGGRGDLLGELSGAYGGSDGPSPAELRAGGRLRLAPPWTLGAFAGLGLGQANAIGSPAWRAGLVVGFEPRPSADADADGVPDVVDRCPAEPEDRDGFADEDGCPDLDNDEDGVPDVRDKCPLQPEDRDNVRDDDGCPDPDNDEDGVPDVRDKCPLEPEDKDGFSDEDGCPDPDNDNDGVSDEDDRCPDAQEDQDGFQDGDGCPDPDDDGDGVPDTDDRCPTQAEDRDGWLDGDGCLDPDDDRDLVPDAVDKCPDKAGIEPDGCPRGRPLAVAHPDGRLELRFALEFAPGTVGLLPNGPRVVQAIARAAHHAGWDEAQGDALIVTVPGDGPAWSDLAARRSAEVVRRLQLLGIRARVEAHARATEATFRATPEGLAAGARVLVKGSLLSP